MKNIFEIVSDLLKTEDKYVAEDGKLLKATVYSDVMTMNEKLLELLLSDETVKERFFKNINGTLIFDKQKFAWFIESKEFLPDSYTRYTNKIGLTHKGEFLSKTNDVVLDFPYKDCVLQGGQDKDDQKRKEIFYNEIIASDEISRMLAPKAFTNAKRYTKDGIEENITFNEDDNLIIKGNNLIALDSLLKRYEGKVKCIYIDPPYNTGKDSFNYNDNFNHSTWLTFMKNRLELAKKLLSDDGVIFVQCDDNEQAYLKVLMDDVFGRENFISNFIWKSKSGGANDSKFIAVDHEYFLCYGKNISYLEFNLDTGTEVSTQYNLEDKKGKYALERLDKQSLGYIESLDFPIIAPDGTEYKVYHKNPNQKVARWRWSKKTVEERYDELVFKNGKVYTKNYQKVGTIPRSLLTDERFSRTRTGKTEHTALFGEILFNNPKPENLMKFIIEITTKPNDLVLDFHLGSGTTCAVAHKMGRRYIGVEQMDYIENITLERMKKVIDGEQGGISKAVNWQGGGAFVYCELLEDANSLIEKIQASTEENIASIKELIYGDNRIVPFITKEELKNVDEEFENLTLEEKQQALIKLIDKNKLYVNYSDIEDVSFNVSDEDKNFTKSFYEVE